MTEQHPPQSAPQSEARSPGVRYDPIDEAIEAVRHGRMIILVDDEDRENEGDLVMAAERITPEAINFMAKHGRGLICLTLTEERAAELQLPSMVTENTTNYGTAFTVSIDARQGVTTGISAADRSATIRAAIDPATTAIDLARPGHVFPIKAQKGGVLKRAGQTEGSVDLARLAGLVPAGVICEVMNDDGTMARAPQLAQLALRYQLKLVTIKDLINYRMQRETFVRRMASAKLPTSHGEFEAVVYENELDRGTHVALVKGTLDPEQEILVRVHSGCLTADVFGSRRCDCGEQLDRAMQLIEREGRGVLLYLNQEGRGIGLANKIKAYQLQDEGRDTVQANLELGLKNDLRDYGLGAQILVHLGVRKLRLLTNNPRKIVGLEGYGLNVIERVPLQSTPHEGNVRYLRTKKQKMGHLLDNV
jgi:3,4-dihydroxy 2-butanone 4-phosphate synthase / GTP cyclohydrolase II